MADLTKKQWDRLWAAVPNKRPPWRSEWPFKRGAQDQETPRDA